MQALGRAIDVAEHLVERRLRDRGVGAQGAQALALALQLLHHLGLEVGAAGDVEDLEQRQQRRVVLERVFLAEKELHPLVQGLHPQQGADALVQRKFVADHGAWTRRRAVECRSIA